MVGPMQGPAKFNHRWAKRGGKHRLDEEMRAVLAWIKEHLRSAGPRVIGPCRTERPILVFTDGACEKEGTSIGGVIVTPEGVVECFGAMLNEETIKAWKKRAEQFQVIGQAELYPIYISKLTWANLLKGKRVLYFVDNESARLALVKAYSPVILSLEIIVRCQMFDYEMETNSWYARVPTASNIGDAPSRMTVSEELKKLGARVVAPKFPEGVRPDKVLEFGDD